MKIEPEKSEFEKIREHVLEGYYSDEGTGPLYDAMLDLLAELARRDREDSEMAERSVGG